MTPARRSAPCVVDASVVAGAFFPDEHADACRSLLASGRTLHAPDLVYAETANVIWKRRRRGEIDEQEASALLADILALPLRIAPSGPLVEGALTLALRTDRTVYDCLYLAVALQEDVPMITCDERLVNALSGGPLAEHVAWVAEGN
jgi:predicted nucleic acid-binding protein